MHYSFILILKTDSYLIYMFMMKETINKLYQEIHTHVKEICFLLYIHKETQDEIT